MSPILIRYVTACVVPMVLLIAGGLGKQLIVGEFRWSNFYLGTDFALASLSAGLLNFVDLVTDNKDVTTMFWPVIYTVGYLLVTFGIYLLLLCIHQGIEKRQKSMTEKQERRKERGVWLGFVSNLIGGSLLCAFILLKARGSL